MNLEYLIQICGVVCSA